MLSTDACFDDISNVANGQICLNLVKGVVEFSQFKNVFEINFDFRFQHKF